MENTIFIGVPVISKHRYKLYSSGELTNGATISVLEAIPKAGKSKQKIYSVLKVLHWRCD